MLQNISKNRENKKITLNDIRQIRCAASLIAYPGMTAYAISGSDGNALRHLGHFLSLYIYCVKGTGTNRGKCLWRWDSIYQNTAPSNSGSTIEYSNNNYAVVRYYASETDTDNIFNGLTISEGEIKIIVEVSHRTELCKYADGKSVSSVPISKRFGFLILTPRCPTPAKSGSHFHSVVIFTPKPGLFSETTPSN
jgi:hypothetical protein